MFIHTSVINITCYSNHHGHEHEQITRSKCLSKKSEKCK